jgi:hypothetical protein
MLNPKKTTKCESHTCIRFNLTAFRISESFFNFLQPQLRGTTGTGKNVPASSVLTGTTSSTTASVVLGLVQFTSSTGSSVMCFDSSFEVVKLFTSARVCGGRFLNWWRAAANVTAPLWNFHCYFLRHLLLSHHFWSLVFAAKQQRNEFLFDTFRFLQLPFKSFHLYIIRCWCLCALLQWFTPLLHNALTVVHASAFSHALTIYYKNSQQHL